MKKSNVCFLDLIVSRPEEAFPSDNEHEFNYSDKLEEYLENFFYENLENINELLDKDQDWFYTLRINTYCYLLCANGYTEECLLQCLTAAQREDIINHITLDNYKEGMGQLKENDDDASSLIKGLFNSWCNLEELVSIYYSTIINYHTLERLKIERIIVFEAPPFCGINKLDHFFINGGNYLTSFTFNQVFKFSLQYDEFNNPSQLITPYYQDNEECKNKLKEIKNNIEKAINSGIVYIDLSMIPLPLTSNIRRKWSINKKYLFGDKQLPVLMLEWALEKLKSRFETGGITNPFSPTCQIAIGTPINTSASIFEYYSDKILEIDEGVYVDLNIVNSPEVYKKKPYLKGYTLKQFKFNVIDNINPTVNFVKNAFDFPK
jgi:hypothetical protein